MRACAPLRLAGRQARLLFVVALTAGLLLPGLAAALRPWLAEFVAASLFFVALRIDPRAALGAVADLRRGLGMVLAFQLAMPLLAVALFAGFGVLDTVFALGVVLTLAAAPIAGSPSLTLFVGHDPAPALRLLVGGTLLLPLTVLPVFWAMPALGSAADVFGAAARLGRVIVGAIALAFAVRKLMFRGESRARDEALDGVLALILSGLFIGLMAAVGPALRETPGIALMWLAVVFALNFALQIATRLWLDRHGPRRDAAAAGIVAGNRNIALFLVALPEEVIAPALIYIGCYQIPMYLTPVLLGRFYRPATPPLRPRS